MKRGVIKLTFVTAAVVYLYYYVAKTEAGLAGRFCAGLIALYFFNEWALLFFAHRFKSARARAEGGR